IRVLAEARDGSDGRGSGRIELGGAISDASQDSVHEAPRVDVVAAVVGQKVRALKIGDRATAIDVTARDRAPAQRMVVLERRKMKLASRRRARTARRRRTREIEHAPFVALPAVVPALALARARRREVDLFDVVLPHVADHEIVGQPVEAISPRIAKSEGPDFVEPGSRAKERVVGCADRHRATDIEAQQLAERYRDVLRAVAWIVP